MSDAPCTLTAPSKALELLLAHGGPKSHANIVNRQPGALKSTHQLRVWPLVPGRPLLGWDKGVGGGGSLWPQCLSSWGRC